MDDNPGLSLFQAGNINVENALQNQEEAEDLEDQKRRQEEIQNLLTKAMDEFNYDDQSTINSSTNVSVDEIDSQRYKNASMDDQIKILYEVRVREVKTLSEQLENIRAEFTAYKNETKKRILLLEAEKDQSQVSLKQSQAILVSKTEEIIKSKKDSDNLKIVINKLEEDLNKFKEEKDIFRQTNSDLMQQLSLMQTGLTTNTLTDRHFREQDKLEISKLRNSLDAALSKLDKKEKENKSLEAKLKEQTRGNIDLASEKAGVINKLTEHLNSAQSQCQELIQVIEKLSIENQSLKKSATNASVESMKKVDLFGKSELLKGLQKQLEKTENLLEIQKTENENIQKSYLQLSCKSNEYETEIDNYEKQITKMTKINENLQKNIDEQNKEILLLKKRLEDNTQAENQALQNRVRELEKVIMEVSSKSLQENGVQVTGFLNDTIFEANKEEIRIMEQKLDMAYKELDVLKKQLNEANERINSLGTQITLTEECDQLKKCLKEKAAQMEQIILENHKKPNCAVASVNTDPIMENNEILKAKYEADCIKKEIQIRLEIKKEYDAKLEEMFKNCNEQLKMKENALHKDGNIFQIELQQYKLVVPRQMEEISKLQKQKEEDREAVAKLFEIWKEKFSELENENNELRNKYIKNKNYSEELIQKIKNRDAEEAQLFDMIKKETQNAVKLWNAKTIKELIACAKVHENKILEVQNNIEKSFEKANKELQTLETRFANNRNLLEQRYKRK